MSEVYSDNYIPHSNVFANLITLTHCLPYKHPSHIHNFIILDFFVGYSLSLTRITCATMSLELFIGYGWDLQ